MKRIMKTVVLAGLSVWMVLSAGLFPGFAAEGMPKGDKMCKKEMSCHMGQNMSVHQQKYLSYLVKDYAPETQKEWEKAFAERNTLLGMKQDGLKGCMETKMNKKELLEEKKAHKALQASFTQAVKNDDRQALKNLLPQLLVNYKKCTERMSQHLKQMKETIDSPITKK